MKLTERPDKLIEAAAKFQENRAEGIQAVGASGAILPLDRIGVAELERITCATEALGVIENIQPRNHDAWNIQFPSLESLPVHAGERRPLKICVATEDIVGPVRNGGIGTTYSYLAQMLAKMGFDTTILYLRGHECENGTIDDWVAHYGERGVKFVPVPDYAAEDNFQTSSNRWLTAPYNMLRYLLEHHMDVVHVSEWHGSGYFTLLAKKQRLAFAQTLFLVKTSSPWLWNRLYGSHPLERIDDLAKIYAERMSVELADMVIGGSLHLLRWMSSQGYRIPADRTFVQPNLVSFDHLAALKDRRANAFQTRMDVDEIVFFGRLEARKGLFVFCQAIKHILRDGGSLPKKISFMGKPGARLTARPDQDVVDYILSESSDWPCEVQLLTNYQQYEALDYLLSEPRLAVMPSIIENSSLAVYEAAICGIPFVASTSGGTPELVHPDDCGIALCEAHPVPLAEKIVDALKNGAYVSRPSFDNERNIEVWQEFHDNLSKGLLAELLGPAAAEPEPQPVAFSACIYHCGELSSLEATVDALLAQETPVQEIFVAADVESDRDFAAVRSYCATMERSSPQIVLIEASDYDAGLAFNAAARRANGEFLLFMWSGTVLNGDALRALSKVARSDRSDVLNFFYRVTFPETSNQQSYLCATVLGSVSESFFHTELTPMPIAVRAESFAFVDGFSSDYRVLGSEMEFVARAQMLGLTCTTALTELGSVPGLDGAWLRQRGYDISTSHFRLIRPQMAAAPLAQRDLLLATKGLQLKPAKPKGKPKAKSALAPPDDEQTPVGRILRLLAQDVLPKLSARQAAPPPRPPSRIEREMPALIELADAKVLSTQPQQKPMRKREPAAVSVEQTIPASLRRLLVRVGAEGGALYTGRLLAVRNNTIIGWLRDDARPDTPVTIHVFDSDAPVRHVRADQDLATAIPLPSDLRKHAFEIDLTPALSLRRLLKRARQVKLAVGERGDIPLADLAIGHPDLAAAGLDGYCEVRPAGRITGWIWRPDHEEEKVDVIVFVDGKFLLRTTASIHREDLVDAGIGQGDHGFRIQLPKSLRDGVERRVEVFAADSGVLLKRGQMKLVSDALTVN